MSIDEYLFFEETANLKHEYFSGQTYAMVGASRNHNIINGNIFAALHEHLKSSICNVYQGDMKLKSTVLNSTAFYYPDLFVSCDERPSNDLFEDEAILIIEVLSKSTKKYDETAKLMAYSEIPKIIEYCLIDQYNQSITRYTMQNRGLRPDRITTGFLELDSIGLKIPFDEIYRGVRL